MSSTQKTKTGGRPFKWPGKNVKRPGVTIPQDQHQRIKEIGNGNFSAGVRQLLAHYEQCAS